MTEDSLDPKLVNRLTRFLHTSSEVPIYFPGCWMSHKRFEVDKLQAINEIFQKSPNNKEVINIILKAYKDGMYTRFETIAFALTKCILHGSETVKEASYNAALEICDSTEHFMIFAKFTRLLKTGNGRGWCKMMKQWYLLKDPMVLAREVARVKSRHGRSHRTLIRKSHVKVPENSPGHDASIKYAIYGYKRAKQLVGDVEGAKEVIEYLCKVEDMRHCEDPVAAAAMAAENNFSLDYVPGHLLTSQEVWNSILPQFSLDELLNNIQRIHNMGYLGNDSATTAILISLLNNEDYIKKSKVTPIAVYITLQNYKLKSKPMKYEKAKQAAEKEQRRRSRQVLDPKTGLWEWTVTRRHPKEAKHWGIDQPPNPTVLNALNKLIDQTWLNTKPTGKRYMITMDMRHHMFKGRHFCKSFSLPKKAKKAAAVTAAKPEAGAGGDAETEKKSKKHLLAQCFYNKNIVPGYAAIVVALQILKREKNVDIAVFTEEGVKIVTLDRKYGGIEEAEHILRKERLGRVQLDAPIEWAAKNKKKVDAFINIIDRPSRYMELDKKDRGGRGEGGRFAPPPSPDKELVDHCPVRALERYRKQLGVPNSKLIVMSLASHRVGTTDGSHEGVLDIVGIDEHVSQVIDAFVTGQFK